MTHRIAIASILALLVIAAGAAFLMTRDDDDPDTVLQAALSTTCDPTLTRYFDVAVEIEDIPTSHYRYDGTDYHMTMTTSDGRTSEKIRKGNYVYFRYGSDEDWQWSTHDGEFIGICGPAAPESGDEDQGEGERAVANFQYGEFTYRYLGEVTLNGETVKHYASEPQSSAARTEPNSYSLGGSEEVWVDESNYIVQLQRDWTLTIQGDTNSGRILFRLSGIGEPNTITAPIDVPTPS